MTKIIITHSYSDDSDPIILGYVSCSLPKSKVTKIIKQAFADFCKTQPDVDSAFIDWLVIQPHYGFTKIEYDFISVAV